MPTTGLFVSQDEIKLMADEGARGLYDLLLTHQGKAYFSTDLVVSTVAGTTDYVLPQDFYQLTSLRGILGDEVFDIYPFTPAEETILLQQSLVGGQSPWLTRYTIGGVQSVPGLAPSQPARRLKILPIPTQVFSLQMSYVPACVRENNTADDVYYDGVSGWEEWIVWDCVAKMLAKQESDPSFAMAQRQQVEIRIRGLAGALDRLHPEMAVDWQASRRLRARLRVPRWRMLP